MQHEVVLSAADARRVMAEVNRRFGNAIRIDTERRDQYVDVRRRLLDEAFPEQQAFILDPKPRKAAVTTRRAGKTTMAALYHILVALATPNVLTVHICRTTTSAAFHYARRAIAQYNEKWKLGARFNANDSRFYWPNGSVTWVTSADNEQRIDNLRGDAYALALSDESASFGPHFEAMIKEALYPALRDHGGTFGMLGTPGRIAAGEFYKATTGLDSAFSVHRWSFMQNPYLTDEARDIQQILKEDGYADVHDPRFRREYLGEWVADEGMQVYLYSPLRNNIPPITDDQLRVMKAAGAKFLVGVDLGEDDATAIAVGAFMPHDKSFYVVEQFKQSHVSIEHAALKINQFNDKYTPVARITDTGPLKMVVTELNSRYRCGLMPAKKTEKAANIEIMNSDFLAGRIKVVEDTPVTKEWAELMWEDKDRRKEHPKFDNHLCDSILYIWRYSRHFFAKDKNPDIPRGTPTWYDTQADEEERLASLRGPQSGKKWWELPRGRR